LENREKRMKTQMLLSALGRDRVGLADDLADALESRKIEIEDGRMTTFRGRFALIVQVCGKMHNVASLKKDLAELAEGLDFHLELMPIGSTRRPKPAPQYLIETHSSGPSGLSQVTRILKKHQVNIEDLETGAFDGPFTNKITFHMKARITVPSSCPIDVLRTELRALEKERDLDVVISPSPVSPSTLVGA